MGRVGETLRIRLLSFVLLAVVAVDLQAAVSEKYREWREGPVQWIMTSDDQRAWKNVKTDEEASAFIDLFWARRDPTPGSASNEFRTEFDARVKWADENFIDRRTVGKKLIGSMGERGRVYILLGSPSNNLDADGRTTAQAGGGDAGDPTGNRMMGNRTTWLWDGEDARKFDMPKIEVVFIEDPGTRRVQRDPSRTDFGRAAPVAVRKALVNPDMTELPQWAARGGLDPVVVPSLTLAAVPRRVVEESIEETPVSTETEPSAEVQFDGPPVAASSSGASKLTLLAPGTDFPVGATDPFATVQPASTFKSKDRFEWVAQYCSATPKVPNVEVLVGISGPFGGSSTDRVTPPKKMKLTRLASVPGCYAIRGAAPLNKLSAGTYLIRVMFEDAGDGESYDLEKQFVIQ